MTFKSFLPRSLFGRAALILVVPIVTIQLVVSMAFIQRHFEAVTRQMTDSIVVELAYALQMVDDAPSAEIARVRLERMGPGLDFTAWLPSETPMPEADLRRFWDLSGREVIDTLRAGLPGVQAVDLETTPREARIWIDTRFGLLELVADRRRASATNPHQLLVVMLATSLVMTLVAYVFLRNQLRPITRLATAAEAFGRGRHVDYRPSGATEVRAAGHAFLDMRARIERQIETRTALLSGVSHDLRTPLTRMRLELALMPEGPETDALREDVGQMERMVEEFLTFARGDALEDPQDVEVGALVRKLVDTAARTNQPVTAGEVGRARVPLREQAIQRALQNLVDNGLRYGSQVRVGVDVTAKSIRFVVEDDGPGIPAAQREEAMKPFTRLDAARGQNTGGGVGLGLAIAADIARSHGGLLRLGDSVDLGGLKAEIVLAR